MDFGGKSFKESGLPLFCIVFLILVAIERATHLYFLSNYLPGLGLMTFVTSANLFIFAVALYSLSLHFEMQARWIATAGAIFAFVGLLLPSSFQTNEILTLPSPATSWMLLLLGGSIFFSRSKMLSARYMGEFMAGAAAALALTALLGLAAGRDTILDLGPFVTTSFFTSLTVLLLSFSSLQMTKDGAVISLLKDTHAPGRFVRQLTGLILSSMFLVAVLANGRIGPALFSSSSDLLLIFGLMLGLMLLVIFTLGSMLRLEMLQANALESRVSESAAHLEKVLDIAPVGIMRADEFGRILSANRSTCEIYGADSGGLDGIDILDLLPNEYIQDFPLFWADFFKNKVNRRLGMSGNLKGRRLDGSEIFIELYLSPIEMDGRQLAVCAVTDVTERVELYRKLEKTNLDLQRRVEERTSDLSISNEALLQRNSELQQFTHAASHDLQTPLRGIGVYAGVLKDDYADALAPEAVEYIDLIVAEAQRLQRLISDLLVYARIDTKGISGFSPVDLNQVVTEVKDQLARAYEDTDFEIVSDTLPLVPGVYSLLTQLFYNLIENAIKYRSEKPPKISITAREASLEDAVFIEISDNGIGIAAEHHQPIFEVFKRLHRQQDVPGTGIGLSICKRIAERHGGGIDLSSEAGKGTTFCIKLMKHTQAVSV